MKKQRLIRSFGRNRVVLDRTVEWAAAGKHRPAVRNIFPLAETPRGQRRVSVRGILPLRLPSEIFLVERVPVVLPVRHHVLAPKALR